MRNNRIWLYLANFLFRLIKLVNGLEELNGFDEFNSFRQQFSRIFFEDAEEVDLLKNLDPKIRG